MRQDSTPNKPTLLMLGDHFPDPDGCDRAVRAWGLLNQVSTTHRVYLSAVATNPVNLRLWRRVAQRAHRVHIAASSRRWVRSVPFSGEAKAWARQHRFDVMLATSPDAWPDSLPGDLGLALCDLAHVREELIRNYIETEPRPVNVFGIHRWRDTSRINIRRVLTECDHLLVASEQQAQSLQAYSSRLYTMPDASAADAWTRLLTACSAAQPATRTLAVLPVKPVQVRQAA